MKRKQPMRAPRCAACQDRGTLIAYAAIPTVGLRLVRVPCLHCQGEKR